MGDSLRVASAFGRTLHHCRYPDGTDEREPSQRLQQDHRTQRFFDWVLNFNLATQRRNLRLGHRFMVTESLQLLAAKSPNVIFLGVR